MPSPSKILLSKALSCIFGNDRRLPSRVQPGAFQDAQYSPGQRTPPRVVESPIINQSIPAISVTSPSTYGNAKDVHKSDREKIMEYLDSHETLTRIALKDMGIDSLIETDLSYLDLRDASLADAKLWCADLRGAKLEGAFLWGADLRSAKLRGAILSDTNLDYADLTNTDLREAKLKNIAGIFEIFKASIDQNTEISWSRKWLNDGLKSDRFMDATFNHIKNSSGSSVFTIINSLLNIDAKVKCLDEVAEVILENEYLQHNDGSSVITKLAKPLMDSLFKEIAYTDTTRGIANKNICKLADKLIESVFKSDRFFSFQI